MTALRPSETAPQESLVLNASSLVGDDRVHANIYREPAIFEMEMDRIFNRTWVFVAHTSEIPEPGDYKSTFVGRQPVIVSRAQNGEVTVMLNRCRHRGTTVCEGRLGNSKRFRCPYHGWVYSADDGRLVAVPHKQHGYDDEFHVEDMGLVCLPRVDVYCGCVFASFDPDIVDLRHYLGNARPYIEEFCSQGGPGRPLQVTPGINQTVYPGNWKLLVDNAMDNYHVSVVHKIFLDYRDIAAYPPGDTRQARDLGGGHGALYRRAFSDEPRDFGPTGFNALIYPNLVLIHVQLRVIYPVDVGRTRVEVLPLTIAGASDDENAARMRLHEDFFGPAGFGAPDDAEAVIRRIPPGMAADQGDEWVYFARGRANDQSEDDGVLAGHVTNETAHRGFYRQWANMMSERL